LAQVDWVDERHFHYVCRIPQESVGRNCVFNYRLSATRKGVDLSRFQKLTLSIRYSGPAQYVRIGIRNFDPRFSNLEDSNSPKFNTISLHPKDLAKPQTVHLDELHVPEWWITQYDMPREFVHPDISNATAFTIDLFGELRGTRHDIEIDKIEFTGDWISAEHWYLGILCLWMVLGTTYGVSQWVLVLRQNRELRNLSTLDALTKVLNRHGMQQFIDALQANKTPAAVIFIDLDHFKKVNDERGHHGGDRVLQAMGDILRGHTRSSDGLGRWGGEEFVLVCPGMSLSKASDLAEKLRHRIKETNFIPEAPLPVTASFGVSVSHADQDFDEAIRQADQALYLAKSRGRNCVVAAAEDQLHKVTGARRGALALITGRFKLHR
jgi:diguanylate cyclase (GGDEF)-like protein